MLSQSDVQTLLAMLKKVDLNLNIKFPTVGKAEKIDVAGTPDSVKFVIDVNRKGTIKITKCTYQTRYQRSNVLLRVDIDSVPVVRKSPLTTAGHRH